MAVTLEQTWRWFGPNDPITLSEIQQTGASGIVTALHHLPPGAIWSPEEIIKRKTTIEAHGLRWSVVESLPVHEDIKRRMGNDGVYIEHYKQSIRNLGFSGIDTVCFNYMPVLDWSRTDLEVAWEDGSFTTKFELTVFAAFDLHILKRPHAEDDYSEEVVRKATQYFESLEDNGRKKLQQTILLGFPGSLETYSLDELRLAIASYRHMSVSDFREGLLSFLKEVAPVAEESGVRLAIHPDDPPWSLFGLPRVVSTEEDLAILLSASDSPANGLTLCTGSLGASPNNNVVHIASRFAERVHFAHLRNVRITGERDFVESEHLNGVVDMYEVMKTLIQELQRKTERGRTNYRIPFRPDHGRLMPADRLLASQKQHDVYPGYSLVGRMRALAELRGLEFGIRRSLGL